MGLPCQVTPAPSSYTSRLLLKNLKIDLILLPSSSSPCSLTRSAKLKLSKLKNVYLVDSRSLKISKSPYQPSHISILQSNTNRCTFLLSYYSELGSNPGHSSSHGSQNRYQQEVRLMVSEGQMNWYDFH